MLRRVCRYMCSNNLGKNTELLRRFQVLNEEITDNTDKIKSLQKQVGIW